MWMLKEMQGKQTLVFISHCDAIYKKSSEGKGSPLTGY